MEHEKAVETRASERYLFGEMAEEERFEFEAHYFSCETCGEDVRTDAALARGIRAELAERRQPVPNGIEERREPRRGFFAWLFGPAMIPALATLVLGLAVGYQAFVLIPSLRSASAPHAVSPFVLRASARGEVPVVQVSKSAAVTVFAMDILDVPDGSKVLKYELSPANGDLRIAGEADTPAPGAQLLLILRSSEIARPGAWTLVLRTAGGAEIGRYPFTVELK